MSILHKDHKSEESEIRFKFLSDSVLKAFEQDGRKRLAYLNDWNAGC